MKLKIICLLTVLISCSLAASPNRCCYGVRCAGDRVQQATLVPDKAATGLIDDVELLPIHQFFSNF